jgi:hypothetical protein
MEKVLVNAADISHVQPLSKIYLLQSVIIIYINAARSVCDIIITEELNGSFQYKHFWKNYVSALMAVSFCVHLFLLKSFVTENLVLKIDSAASTECHGKYMNCVNFPWPPVLAAHDRKTFARAMPSSRSYWIWKNYPYTQHSVMCIRSYHSFQILQKTISDQNRICCGNQ